MRPRDHNVFVNAGSLVLCGLIAGVVVAAALFPGIAMSGLLAKESLERFDELPNELTVMDGPQISYLYASDGTTLLGHMYDENRRNIRIDEVPQVMIDALLSAEDRNFYEHIGVDARGIARAFIANTGAGDITQGASTVTQQFVRLALTYFADHPQEIVEATEDTHARKLREARLAMAVENQMSKDEILERYLNLAYFGEGAYGVFAASQVYFGKRPMDLDLHEAALLAGIVKAPSDFSPASESRIPFATERRNWVIDQMVETGAITASEAREAKAIEIEPQAERQPNECVNTVEGHWGFFCDYFFRWWMDQEVFGATPWERERRLKGGGYHIVTTLDASVQKAMKKHVDAQIETSASEPHALMVTAVEPGTGKVRAMATNRNFSLDESGNGPHTDPFKRDQGLSGTYPNTTNPLMAGGGDIFGYQSGSTAKLYTMIAALEQGLPLDHNIVSPHRVTTRFVVEPGGPSSCGNRWCPVNYPGQAPGLYNMWTAFGASINTYFAQLIQQAGANNAVDVAKRLGVQFREPVDAVLSENASGWGAFTLGVAHTTPLDLANAFGTVSAEGIACQPLPVEEIRTVDGETLDVANTSCRRAIDKDIALAAIDAGRCVVGNTSKFGECEGATARFVPDTGQPTTSLIQQPIWGKTGTADGTRTYSFVLSTKQLTVAGQLADPDWADTTYAMEGAKVRAAVMHTMADAMAGKESQDWARPGSERLVYGERVNIPDVECLPLSEAEALVDAAGFDVMVDDEEPVDSACEAGLAAGTTPTGSTSRGSTIMIQVSNGSEYEEPEPEPEPEPTPPDNGPPGNGPPGGGNGD
jgi:membrane peptidoglycan carboxypeptidase